MNGFAAPRMDPSEVHDVKTKLEAEQRWAAPLFRAELAAGRDPMAPVVKKAEAAPGSVAAFLDDYFEKYVKPRQLAGEPTVAGYVKVLKAHFGELPVSALEDADRINQFKTSDYAREHKVASAHRVLEALRTAINWGMAQKVLRATPFHRFGVTLNKKAETKRDRRVSPEEERALLQACNTLNCWEHRWCGPAMRDRIVGAIETLCRRGEMLKIQNRHVRWDTHQIAIPGAHAKDEDNKLIPFDPEGPLAPILERRKKLGPLAYVFGSEAGAFVGNFQTAWEAVRLLA